MKTSDKITPKELLTEINKLFPVLKHITKDLNGEVWFYEDKPEYRLRLGLWTVENCGDYYHIPFSPELAKTIDWGTDNWTECICSL